MRTAILALIGMALAATPASAVVIVSGTASAPVDTTSLSGAFTYNLQGSGNAIVFGSYIDNNFTAGNVLFNGSPATGTIQEGRTFLSYYYNPDPTVNVTFDLTAGAGNANGGYFLYELSFVDTGAAANVSTGASITTTSADRFVVNYSGINFGNGAGSVPAPGSVISSSNITDFNGAIGGGALASGTGFAGAAGVQTLGWAGGPAFQGAVAVAFAAAPGSPVPWNVNGGGSFNSGANWLGGAVPANNPFFGTAHATATTANISLDAPVSVSAMTISNVNPYNITGPSTLTLTGAADILVGEGTHTISATVAGSVGLTKTGGGNLVLSGANSYTGTTNVQGGSLQLANSASVGGAVNVAATGQLAFVSGYNGSFAGDVSGAGGVLLDASLTTGSVSFNGAKSYTGTTQISGGTLAVSNADALGAGDSTPATGTTISTNGSTANGKLALSGGVNVANELLTIFPRRGDGVADLVHVTSTGNNTWGGNIKGDVNGDNYNFESTSGTLTLGGTISAPDGDNGIRNFVFKGNGSFNVTDKIIDFDTNANGEQTISSLDTQANVFVYKQGSGTLTIRTGTSNADDFWKGGTFVEGGALEVIGNANAGELWGPLTVQSGATLDVDSFTTYAMSEGSSLAGGGVVQASTFKVFADNSLTPGDGVGTLTINGNLQLSDEFGSQGGVMQFQMGNNPAIIGGVENDLIKVNGVLSTIGSPDMTVRIVAAEGSLSAGSYRLIDANSGVADVSGLTPAFLDALGNPLTTRQTLGISSTNGQVNLDVTGSAANLTWTGANGTLWNKNSAQNWSDGSPQVFFDQDQVTFNDTVAVPLPGDFNGDRSVDAADYTVWRDNLGTMADLNGNGNETGGSAGVVDAADYDLWKASFGQTSAGVAVNISGADVYPSVANFDSATGNRFAITGTHGIGGETPINLTGNVTVALQNTNNLQGEVSLSAGTTLELGGGSTVGGNISGAGTLNINGGATLASANSLTGPILINSQVFPQNGGAFGTADSGTTINAGGNLWFNFQNLVVSEPITFNGGLMNVAGNADSALTLTGPLNMAAGGTFNVNPGLGDDALTVNANITGSAGGQLNANVGVDSRMTVTGNITNNGALVKTGVGAMVIGASASITSPRIVVNGGSLDITSKPALSLASGQTLSGNFGTVTGNVVATSGSTVRVGQEGLQDGTIYTYTDANWTAGGNTVVAADNSLVTLAANNTQPSSLWTPRVTFGNGGSVLQGRVAALGDSAPTLKTTIGGLTPGEEYQVLVNFWNDGSGWQIQAGDSAGTLSVFNPGNSTNTTTLPYSSLVNTAEGNRTMFGAPLTLTANGSGQIELFIDDNSASVNGVEGARTWYDGVSVAFDTVIGQTFNINGDLSLTAGSTALFDIAGSGVNDLLNISGALSVADGFILEVLLDDSVAAGSLVAGDSWNLFDFASASGSFNAANFILPTGLAGGLVWDTSNLLTTGVLSVAAGAAIGGAGVPEPSTAVLLGLAAIGFGVCRTRRSSVKR